MEVLLKKAEEWNKHWHLFVEPMLAEADKLYSELHEINEGHRAENEELEKSIRELKELNDKFCEPRKSHI
jgi:hypothetical protein